MEALVETVTQFVASHRAWVFWVALAFAFAETLAFVSILVPSTAILVGIGGLAATGGVDFLPIWAGAAIGAVSGSSVSFWLGHEHGDRILSAWPLSRHPEIAERGRRMFARRGALAVMIGHFFGPVRPVVFLLAGMARMPVAVFAAVNLAGAVAWAFVVPKSGQIGGDILGRLWQLF